MDTDALTDLSPRLFGQPRLLGQDGAPVPSDDDPDGDDGDYPPCVDCAAGKPVGLDGIRVGDRVTELGSDGPWYPVLEVDTEAGLLVLDGRDDGDDEALPVRIFAVDMDAGVLKHPESPAT